MLSQVPPIGSCAVTHPQADGPGRAPVALDAEQRVVAEDVLGVEFVGDVAGVEAGVPAALAVLEVEAGVEQAVGRLSHRGIGVDAEIHR